MGEFVIKLLHIMMSYRGERSPAAYRNGTNGNGNNSSERGTTGPRAWLIIS